MLRKYFDDAFSEVEREVLERLLVASPEAADQFAHLTRLETSLADIFHSHETRRRMTEWVAFCDGHREMSLERGTGRPRERPAG